MYIDGVTPNTQTILEGTAASWMGDLTFSDTDHGSPTLMYWDFDRNAAVPDGPDLYLCDDSGVNTATTCSDGASGSGDWCTRVIDTWTCPSGSPTTTNVYTDSRGTGAGPTFTWQAFVHLDTETPPAIDEFQKDVTVQNVAPNSIIDDVTCNAGEYFCGAPTTLVEGQDLDFDTDALDAGLDPVTEWRHAFGNGDTLVCRTTTGAPCGADVDDISNYAYPDEGTYTYTFTACDEEPGPGDYFCDVTPASSTLTIVDVEPDIVSIVSNSDPVDEGDAVTFTATVEVDDDDEITSCLWDFGDGNTDATTCNALPSNSGTVTIVATHTYADEDDCGGGSLTGGTGPTTVLPNGIEIPFGGQGYIFHGGQILYGAPSGLCTVQLDVEDEDAVTTSDTYMQTVNNDAPVFTSTPNVTIDEGQAATITAMFTDKGINDALWTLRMDCDDNGTYEETSTHGTDGDPQPITAMDICPAANFPDGPATHDVNLIIEDEDGDQDFATITVTVNNLPPVVLVVNLNGPAIDEGDDGMIRVDFTDDSLGPDTHTCTITWGDGNTTGPVACTSGDTFSNTYDDGADPSPTTYGVSVDVEDDNGGIGNDTTQFDVANVTPTVALNFIALEPEPEGRSGTIGVNYDLSDPGNLVNEIQSLSIDWDDGTTETICDNDGGSAPPPCVDGAGQTFTSSHSYTDDDEDVCTGSGAGGNCNVTLTATDKDTASATTADLVPPLHEVTNVAPDNVAVSGPSPVDEGTPYNWTVTFDDDGSNDTHTCDIDWGDGLMDLNQPCTSGNLFSHTYADGLVPSGTATISVTVTDDDGGVSASPGMLIVTVDNVNPTISAVSFVPEPEVEGDVGTLVNFTIADDGTDASELVAGSAAVTIDWGDGVVEDLCGNAAPACTGPGAYSVTSTHVYLDDAADACGASPCVTTLVVTDKDGGSSAGLNVDHDVLNDPPANVSITGPGTVDEGTNATYTVNFTDAGASDTHMCTIDWGDGSPNTGPTPCIDSDTFMHLWTEDTDVPGPNVDYVITLTVEDDDTGTGQDTLDQEVNDVDPVITVGLDEGAGSYVEGDMVTFTATYETGDPVNGTDDITTCVFDPDGPGTASSITFTVGVDPECTATDFSYTYLYTDDDTDKVPPQAFPSDADTDSMIASLDVNDEDSLASTSDTVVVANVAPGSLVLASNTPHPEGQFTALTVDWLDPSVNCSDTGLADVYEITIDWDDGNVDILTAGPNQGVGPLCGVDPFSVTTSHLYSLDGTYTITVTVEDDDGGMVAGTETVVVTPVPIDVTSVITNAPVPEGSPATIWIVAEGPAGVTLVYSYDWSGPIDNPPGPFAASPPDVVDIADAFNSYAHNDDTTRVITVRAADSADPSSFELGSVTVVWTNVPPTASAAASDVTPTEGQLVTFTPTFTDPSTADVSAGHTCDWDFGDGNTAATAPGACTTGLTVNHTYTQNGSYTVTLTVTDKDGGIGTDTLTVTVSDEPPVISSVVAVPNPVDEGSSTTITTTASDPAGDPLTYHYDLDNDLVYERVEAGPGADVITHTFQTNGLHTVNVKVVDDANNDDTDSVVISVQNVAPSGVAAAASAGSGTEGDTLTFTGTFTDPGTSNNHTCDWDFGDGTPVVSVACQPGDTVNHTYTDNDGGGGFDVTLTVDDGTAAPVTSAPVNITIANANPVTISGGNQTGAEGAPVNFSGTFSDAGSSDTHTCTWDFGDGTVVGPTACTSPTTITHTYTDDQADACGTQPCTVSLTVTDDDGGANAAASTATISNVAPTIDAGPNQQDDELVTFTFTATASDPAGANDPLTYAWDFGDGNTGSGISDTNAYAQNGTYTVIVTVDDGDGGVSSDSLTVVVDDLQPSITSTVAAPATVNEGSATNVTITATDPANDPLTYQWDFDGDGTFEISQTTNVASHVFLQEGVFVVTARVTDDAGQTNLAGGNDTATVTVNNVAPGTVTATRDNAVVDEGDLVTFTGTFTDPGNDTHTCTWDFGDSVVTTLACTSGDTIGHTYTQEGAYTATLTVDDGTDSDSDTVGVTVNNVLPSVSVGANQTGAEGSQFSFSATFTDPGAADTHTCSWTFGDGNSVPAAACTSPTAAVNNVYADNGVYTVTVTVNDGTGSSAQQITAVVNNVAPVANASASLANADEFQMITFTHAYSDAGAADTHTCVFDFGDGNSFATGAGACVNGGTTSHSYADNGSYTVTLTVTDDDGGSSTDTLTITVNDLAPTLGALAQNGPVNEGSPVTVSAPAASDPSNDPLTYEWDFDGDGTFEVSQATSSAIHTFSDNGSNTVTVRVRDDAGNSDTGNIAVMVNNVAPVIDQAPIGAQGAIETELFQLSLTSTDPAGPADPATWTLTSAPLGMGISQTGTISWVPTYSQSGRPPAGMNHNVDVMVDDGDGGTATASFTITAVWVDDDNDGMADTWEIANGMDPTVDDSMGDVDGDGVLNIWEFNNANGGPYTPDPTTPVLPLTGQEENNADTTLTLNNTMDLDSATLFYVFEVYADAALTTLLFDNTGAPEAEGAGGTTSVTLVNGVDVNFVDNTTYHWRGRATDGVFSGEWTEVQSFFYNPTNDAPTAPLQASPLDQADVPSLTPTLVCDNSTDADDPTLTYSFDIYADAALTMLVDSSGPLAEGPGGNTTYVSGTVLTDNTWYYWTCTATDPHALGTVSVTGSFFVNQENDEPTVPTLVSPVDGEWVTVDQPILTVGNSIDPDDVVLEYLFELDSTPSFSSPDYQTSGFIPEGTAGGNTTWTPAQLNENVTYWWRVRATDGFATGEFLTATFFVNVQNDPPEAPVGIGPANGALVNADEVSFAVRNATDPDDSLLTYNFYVYTDENLPAGNEFDSVTGIAEGNGNTTWGGTNTYNPGRRYFWVASATDDEGLEGPVSEMNSFETLDVTGGGCGCVIGTSAPSRPFRAAWLLLPLALVAILIRRRRS